MALPPTRPDLGRDRAWWRTARFSALGWLAVMAVVGGIGLEIIVRVQDASGTTPPTSMFTAAAVLISLISTIAVCLAARSSGVAMRASIALGGAFGAIAVAKFALGPVAFF